MRALSYINAFGVLVLAALCVFQWRFNRALNLRTNEIEKSRIAQAARIDEQEKEIKAQAADLESFRAHVQRAAVDLKSAESNLLVARREGAQLTSERDQLKESVTRWAEAVAERDAQLVKASEQIGKLGADRNDAVAKFNSLAAKHNEMVDQLNERTREYNSVVERFNALAKSRPQQSNN